MKFPWAPFGLIVMASLALQSAGEYFWPQKVSHDSGQHLVSDFPNSVTMHALAHWDANWYADISENGYFYQPNVQSSVAFFPLFPLLIKGITFISGNKWVSAELLSLSAGILAMFLFFQWAKKRFPEQAHWALFTFALYPFAIYFYGVVYSDGLFLSLVIGSFLALEHRRYFLCALIGIAATACRPLAPALILGLLARSFEMRRSDKESLRAIDFVPALSGFGLLAYMSFLYFRFNDPLAFMHVQGAPGWDQAAGWHTWLKITWFEMLFPKCSVEVGLVKGGHALCTLLAIALVKPTFKKLGFGYGVFCAVAVAIPAISSKDFHSVGRYVMAAFPLFLTASILLSEHRGRHRVILGILAAFFVLCAVSFGAGYYIA
jgi:hypothetical protein